MDREYWQRRDYIEFCFKYEDKIKQAIVEKRKDPNRPISAGHGSGISKPTEIEAINNVMPLLSVVVEGKTIYYPEQCVRVVGMVKIHYCYKQHGLLYNLRYREKSIRSKTIKEMNISKTRYHQLIIEIIDYALKCAEELNIDISKWKGVN